MEKVAVVGVGYVGLVAGACFAHVGHDVVCVDVDEKKVDSLNKGQVPFFEPDLESYVHHGIKQKKISFTTSYVEALQDATFIVLAVDTPQQQDGSCDTRNIFKAAQSIGQEVSSDLFVIVKSTVPVGTCDAVEKIIQEALDARQAEWHVEVISNPEFLKEGAAVHDFIKPDRIIVGVTSERAEEMIRRLYAPFKHLDNTFFVMDRPSSELTKYASNTMLALRISYMNWLSEVCEKTGADIDSVRMGLGADRRIGNQFLRAGVGFGGSCFPKDIKALAFLAQSYNVDTALVDAIDSINEWQKSRFAQMMLSYANEHHAPCNECQVALLGLSFKPHTDDMRKAPSLTIIRELLDAGLSLRVHDPIAMPNAKLSLTQEQVSKITWCDEPMDALKDAHLAAILTEWPSIAQLHLPNIRSAMKGIGLFDGRGVFKQEEADLYGFHYFCLGKSSYKEPLPPRKPYAYVRNNKKKT